MNKQLVVLVLTSCLLLSASCHVGPFHCFLDSHCNHPKGHCGFSLFPELKFFHHTCYCLDFLSNPTHFHGPHCQFEDTCNGTLWSDEGVCNGHGVCDKQDDCHCDSGWWGLTSDACDNEGGCFGKGPESEEVCSMHGTCTVPDQCECDENYSGEECEDFECSGIHHDDSTVCSMNGQCIDHNTCVCDEGFFGGECEQFQCHGLNNTDPTVCSDHGECHAPDDCECIQPNYFGEECELFQCWGVPSTHASTCSGNGDCVDYNDCNCDNGFSPPACAIDLAGFQSAISLIESTGSSNLLITLGVGGVVILLGCCAIGICVAAFLLFGNRENEPMSEQEE